MLVDEADDLAVLRLDLEFARKHQADWVRCSAAVRRAAPRLRAAWRALRNLEALARPQQAARLCDLEQRARLARAEPRLLEDRLVDLSLPRQQAHLPALAQDATDLHHVDQRVGRVPRDVDPARPGGTRRVVRLSSAAAETQVGPRARARAVALAGRFAGQLAHHAPLL